ncbi:MAG: hypothetical protein FJZ47_14500 [Candidatus Tectomicrobia bacterium]|uniref:DUF5659 domain-containing protein n=1 Tax=Tectimicrobiota bacterium TaxID=2528274 RepID=A0A938B1I6_UNCTE|nr:hypothetical protein [Candidatus Tectomicrobia bacterium]
MTEITDYFLAVYLIATGAHLTEVRVQPKETFCFVETPTLAQHIEAYRTDTALVNPKVFARTIMELRQQLKQRYEAAS